MKSSLNTLNDFLFSVGVATITSQQAQNQSNSSAQPGIVTNNLPLLVRILNHQSLIEHDKTAKLQLISL